MGSGSGRVMFEVEVGLVAFGAITGQENGFAVWFGVASGDFLCQRVGTVFDTRLVIGSRKRGAVRRRAVQRCAIVRCWRGLADVITARVNRWGAPAFRSKIELFFPPAYEYLDLPCEV